MVRSEFGCLPLIIDAHMRTWNYIKYLKNKPDGSLVKISYELEFSPKIMTRFSMFVIKYIVTSLAKILKREQINLNLENLRLNFSLKTTTLIGGKRKLGVHQHRRRW